MAKSVYTPDEDAVRRVYSLAPLNLAACPNLNPTPEYASAAFDRWLAEVKAQVWDEGYVQACDGRTFYSANPYIGDGERAARATERKKSD